MAKATKKTRSAYIATRTIHAGTPKKPETIAPGDEVEGLSADEIKSLLGSGAIREEKVAGEPDQTEGGGGGGAGGDTPPAA